MTRKSFLGRLIAGVLALPFVGCFRTKNKGPYERSFRYKLCIRDMFPIYWKNGKWDAEDNRRSRADKDMVDRSMTLICALLNDGFRASGQPVEINWINILDREENPLGEIGLLHVRMYAKDQDAIEVMKRSCPSALIEECAICFEKTGKPHVHGIGPDGRGCVPFYVKDVVRHDQG